MAKFTDRYGNKNYDRITFRVKKGNSEQLDKIAKERGISKNKLIALALEKETGLSLTLDKEEPWKKFQKEESND